MGNVYEIGDLIVTRQYGADEKIEVCIFKGQIGSLFKVITDCEYWQSEKFIKNCDSLPYSKRVIRAAEAQDFINSKISNKG